jgi:hypothetical protein
VTDSTKKIRSRSVVSGLVLAAPLAAAALASATLVGSATASAHQSSSTHATVSALFTTVRAAATEPKIPAAAGD